MNQQSQNGPRIPSENLPNQGILTAELNTQSIESLRREIERKNSSLPYYANINTVKHIITDYDHHPYTRWFRGVYYYPEPVIAEREAGWRPQEQQCYDLIIPGHELEKPHHCFQAACSTTFLCNPVLSGKEYENNAELFSRHCIVQYR